MEGCGGFTNFDRDYIEIQWPLLASPIEVLALSANISHELAHHIIQEYFGDWQEGVRLGVNLPHFASNSGKYLYRKGYALNKIRGRVPKEIIMFDVASLVQDKDKIMEQIRRGVAPRGKDPYTI